MKKYLKPIVALILCMSINPISVYAEKEEENYLDETAATPEEEQGDDEIVVSEEDLFSEDQ